MRLATFNILHGRSLADGLVDPARVASAVRTLDADVLGIQEVDRDQSRSAGADHTAAAAETMSAVDWRFEPAIVGTPGASWTAAVDGDHVGGDGMPHYGVGLVSRYPVTQWHVLRLAPASVRSPIVIPGSRKVVWLEDEPRVALCARLDSPVGPLTVATTHLSFVPVVNGVQLRTLVRELRRALPPPYVLLGDLNLPGSLPRWLTGWQPLAVAKTYPAPKPAVQLDHVLGHGRLPAVLRTSTPRLDVSDHRALVVDFAG